MYLTSALATLLLVASQGVEAGRASGVGSVNKRHTLLTDELALLRLDQSLAPQYAYNASIQVPPRRPGRPGEPEKCPPCFNCLLPAFQCGNAGDCNPYDGQCRCPPGFGGQDCLTPSESGRAVYPRSALQRQLRCIRLIRSVWRAYRRRRTIPPARRRAV